MYKYGIIYRKTNKGVCSLPSLGEYLISFYDAHCIPHNTAPKACSLIKGKLQRVWTEQVMVQSRKAYFVQ
jgi:hypothetical protein